MNPHDLYLAAKRLGLDLRAVRKKLVVTPGDRCPAEFADLLREHKDPLVTWLRQPVSGWQGVPPNDLALQLVQQPPPMRQARRLMDYITRQIGDRPNALCEWCLRRELAYWEAYHWPDQVCAYAGARDCASWQLRRSELEVWEFLEGTEEAVASFP